MSHSTRSLCLFAGLTVCLAAACTQNDGARFLNFEVSQAAQDAPWPSLEPLSSISAPKAASAQSVEAAQTLGARAAQLRAKAAALNAPILSAADKATLAR